MQKTEVLELKKRFVKEKATFDMLSGCYVDVSKNKVCDFHQKFLTLGEEEFFKYLDIAKKSLSGTVGNNLLEYEFPNVEEATGGKQQALMALLDAPDNDTLLQAYYDHIINTYQIDQNYLILIFHDNYDVMTKTTDKQTQDESEEVFQYLLISICPVELDKPALHYNPDEIQIKSRERDWVVGSPETAILFPAFTDRSADIHSCVVYSKNPKEQHKEFVESGLGCDSIKTKDEMREEFYSVIRSSFNNEEQANRAVLSAAKDIHDVIKSNYSDDNRPSELNANDIKDMLSEDSRFSDEILENIAQSYAKTFQENPSADIILDESLLKKNEDAVHVLELEDSIAELNRRIDVSLPEDKVKISVPEELSNDVCMQEINGSRYVTIPSDLIDILVNGIKIN